MRIWKTCWECKSIEESHLPFVVKHQGMMRCINCAINKYKLYNQGSVKDLYQDIRDVSLINDFLKLFKIFKIIDSCKLIHDFFRK